MSTDSPPPEHKQPDSSIEAINQAASILPSGVDPHQVRLYELCQHLNYYLFKASIYENAIKVLEQATNQSQSQDLAQTTVTVTPATLTATEIGEMLVAQWTEITYRLSGQRVNHALEKMGFHARDYRGIWHLTELGKTYGELVQRGHGQGKTYWQVRWMPTVLDRLAPLFTVSC